jgi:elongation factor Ts
MADISASMVKDLREKTGAGMMDCKAALTENAGDMEAAIDWLRKKGLSKAAKKSDRVAAEGLIGVIADGKHGAVIEINSETDFVARNAKFQDIVRAVSSLAIAAKGEIGMLKVAHYPGSAHAVEVEIKEAVATIGENMNLRRTAYVEVKDGIVASYVHNATAPGMGKIGVLVALESTGDKAKLMEFGKNLAMHIAAANPLALHEKDLDPVVIARERAIYEDQAQQTGKAPDIAAKMAEGRLRKEFFQQSVLMAQTYVLDGKETVAKVVAAQDKVVGAPVEIKAFVRFALGEGIDKPTGGDFAAEVAAMSGQK